MDIKKQEELAKEYGIHTYKIRFVEIPIFTINTKTYEVIKLKDIKKDINISTAVINYPHYNDKEKIKTIVAQINSSVMTYIFVDHVNGLDNKKEWKLAIR